MPVRDIFFFKSFQLFFTMKKVIISLVALLSINTMFAQLGEGRNCSPQNVIDTTFTVPGFGAGCEGGYCSFTQTSFPITPRNWVDRIDSLAPNMLLEIEYGQENVRYQSSSVRAYSNSFCKLYWKGTFITGLEFGEVLQGVTIAEGGYIALFEPAQSHYYLPSTFVFIPFEGEVVKTKIKPSESKKFWKLMDKYDIGNADWRFLML
jgi:hypothetical protein